jgi:hypothetical protein
MNDKQENQKNELMEIVRSSNHLKLEMMISTLSQMEMIIYF